MKNLKAWIVRLFRYRVFMFWNIIIMLNVTDASATDISHEKAFGNSIYLSELDFKQMILESKADTVKFDQFLKKHLQIAPTWLYSTEFMIMNIPVNKAVGGISIGNGQKMFKKPGILNWKKK